MSVELHGPVWAWVLIGFGYVVFDSCFRAFFTEWRRDVRDRRRGLKP